MYEVDQRHAEIIMRELGMTKESNTTVTPGARDTRLYAEEAGELLDRGMAKMYKGNDGERNLS